MKDNVVVLSGSSIIYIYESVSLETLRDIVADLEDPGFGHDHIHAIKMAEKVLYRRELAEVQDLDTLVIDIDPFDTK